MSNFTANWITRLTQSQNIRGATPTKISRFNSPRRSNMPLHHLHMPRGRRRRRQRPSNGHRIRHTVQWIHHGRSAVRWRRRGALRLIAQGAVCWRRHQSGGIPLLRQTNRAPTRRRRVHGSVRMLIHMRRVILRRIANLLRRHRGTSGSHRVMPHADGLLLLLGRARAVGTGHW